MYICVEICFVMNVLICWKSAKRICESIFKIRGKIRGLLLACIVYAEMGFAYLDWIFRWLWIGWFLQMLKRSEMPLFSTFSSSLRYFAINNKSRACALYTKDIIEWYEKELNGFRCGRELAAHRSTVLAEAYSSRWLPYSRDSSWTVCGGKSW